MQHRTESYFTDSLNRLGDLDEKPWTKCLLKKNLKIHWLSVPEILSSSQHCSHLNTVLFCNTLIQWFSNFNVLRTTWRSYENTGWRTPPLESLLHRAGVEPWVCISNKVPKLLVQEPTFENHCLIETGWRKETYLATRPLADTWECIAKADIKHDFWLTK